MNVRASKPEYFVFKSNREASILTPVLLVLAVLSLMLNQLPGGPTTAVAAFIQEGCVPAPAGMTSWWPGDSDANDIVGLNHGALQNGATFAAGFVGQGFSLDGSDDYVRVPTADSLNPTGSLTLDAWIFPTADISGAIISKWGDQGDYDDQRAYVLEYLPGGQINFAISDDAHQDDGSFHAFASPANAVTLNAWSHIAGVYDQATGARRIYVNGIQVAERTDAPITITSGDADFTIGADQRSSTTAEFFFAGLIDEVEMFNRALSQEEIAAIHGAGSAGKCKDSEPASSCPRSQGHWKNNPDLWPADTLTLGSQSYTRAELLTILNTPVGSGKTSDASLILAHQLIAAKLNLLNGSDPDPIVDAIIAADFLLAGQAGKLPYSIRPSSSGGQSMVGVANTLESYNQGELTPFCVP